MPWGSAIMPLNTGGQTSTLPLGRKKCWALRKAADPIPFPLEHSWSRVIFSQPTAPSIVESTKFCFLATASSYLKQHEAVFSGLVDLHDMKPLLLIHR